MGILSNLLLLTAASVAMADTAAPATPRITSITYSGSGCAKDPKFSGNFNDPTVTFNSFAASLPGSQTLNCQVHLQANGASPGWQVALKTNVIKGRVYLTPGTSLTHYTTVFFSQDAGRSVSPSIHPSIQKGDCQQHSNLSQLYPPVSIH
jgi:hypothetical protein